MLCKVLRAYVEMIATVALDSCTMRQSFLYYVSGRR